MNVGVRMLADSRLRVCTQPGDRQQSVPVPLENRAMCGQGDPLQYSVFRCELSAIELHGLKETLWPILNLAEDRVMIVDLGPVEGRGDECIEFLGEPRVAPPERAATIVQAACDDRGGVNVAAERFERSGAGERAGTARSRKLFFDNRIERWGL